MVRNGLVWPKRVKMPLLEKYQKLGPVQSVYHLSSTRPVCTSPLLPMSIQNTTSSARVQSVHHFSFPHPLRIPRPKSSQYTISCPWPVRIPPIHTHVQSVYHLLCLCPVSLLSLLPKYSHYTILSGYVQSENHPCFPCPDIIPSLLY